MVLSDFINLTQVHNFTASAQDIFTFRRLSVFTVSFMRILQVHELMQIMQIMKRFALYYWLVNSFFYFTSLFDSFNFIIIDVPRPLSNVFWIIIFKRLMRNAYTEPVCLETYVLQKRIVHVIKRLKPLFLDSYFQFCKYSHASKLFVYLYLHLLLLFLQDPHRERLPYARYVKLNLCAFDIFFTVISNI